MGARISTPIVICSLVGTCYAGVIMAKEHFGGKNYEDMEKKGQVSAEGKVVIVTGANTGIGRETALELAKRKAKVIMACRNIEKCEKARENIVLETKNKHVYCRLCDLASQKSIRQFAERFKKENDKLHILINNAGVMMCPYSKTQEGIEMQLGVNHMGHFLLTNLLLDRLKESVPSRVINLTSIAHFRGEINKEDLNSEESYDPGDAYNQSKLANVLFTKELARRLLGSGVTVNAVNPGMAYTEINRHLDYTRSWLSEIFVKPFAWLVTKAPRQAVQTVIFASLDPELERVTGRYFSDCSEESPAIRANDVKTAKWLWLVSEKWTRLNS